MAHTYPPPQQLVVNNPRKAGAIFTLIGAILVYFAVVPTDIPDSIRGA